MTPQLLCCGAIFGFVAVAFGAFGAHGLRGLVAPEQLAVWRTAVEYQMFHALALLALAAAPTIGEQPAGRFAGRSFILGVALFSGSLYLLALTGTTWLGAITPLGGLCLIAGWGRLAIHGWREWRGAPP